MRWGTIRDVTELSTTEPGMGACRSPMISSSEKSTAAIAVLKAAESAAAAPTGTQPANLGGTQAEPACEHGGDSRADLDGRTFTAERDPARQRGGAAHEVADDRPELDAPVMDEDCRTRLRDAAAPGIRKPAQQKDVGPRCLAGPP